MSDEPTSESDAEGSPPALDPAPDLRPLYHSDAVEQAEHALFDAIARSTLDAIFATPIDGMHINFSGSVPFAQEHLESWVETLGAIATPDRLDPSLADRFVLGRLNLDADLVDHLVGADVRFFSQEEFLSLVLFGEEATIRNLIDAASNPHPGLELVEQLEMNFQVECDAGEESESLGASESDEQGRLPRSVPFQTTAPTCGADGRSTWTHISDEPGDEPFDDATDLKVESELKKLGYSVAKHVPLARRQSSLELGVQHLGLTKVVNHLRWLIYFQRKNPQQRQAVANWRYDLDWLQSRHGP